MKDGALPLQTSLSHRELPPRAPACTWQRFVSLCTVRVLSGEVFVAWGGTDLLQSAASRLIGERGAFRYNAIHECRDSACWRPCGVRLRGSSSFYRLIFNICAAPLRMTQRVDFCMGDTMSICQSIIATNRLYLTEHHTLRVILSEAAQQCNGERESRQMPRSRTPKGRRQAESRHSRMAL